MKAAHLFFLLLPVTTLSAKLSRAQNCATDDWPTSIGVNLSRTFSVSATSGASYRWSVTSAGGSASIQGSSTTSSISIRGNTSGSVTVCVTVTKGSVTATCCKNIIIGTGSGTTCNISSRSITMLGCSPCFPSQHPDWRFCDDLIYDSSVNYKWTASSNVQFLGGTTGNCILLKPTNQGIFTLTITVTSKSDPSCTASKTIVVDPETACGSPYPGECGGGGEPKSKVSALNSTEEFIEGLTIAPNPANQAATVSYTVVKDGIVNITLINESTGETTSLVREKKEKGKYDKTLQTNKFSKGRYIISLYLGSKLQKSQRLIIE